MIKMVVSDFDNTLMIYPNKFSEEQIVILKRLKEKDIKFGIVTGRSINFFKQFPELLSVTDYIISSNGGSIYDIVNNKFIYSLCINQTSLEKMIELGLDNRYTFIINEMDKVYKYGDLKKIDSIEFINNKEYKAEQIIFYIEDYKLNRFKELIKKVDGILINNINSSTQNGVYAIDINHKDVSKGNGLLWFCDHLNIDTSEVIAFGDGENDLSMFRVIDKCVCVDNASYNLKKCSYDMTDSCIDNGVFKYIEDNILK